MSPRRARSAAAGCAIRYIVRRARSYCAKPNLDLLKEFATSTCAGHRELTKLDPELKRTLSRAHALPQRDETRVISRWPRRVCRFGVLKGPMIPAVTTRMLKPCSKRRAACWRRHSVLLCCRAPQVHDCSGRGRAPLPLRIRAVMSLVAAVARAARPYHVRVMLWRHLAGCAGTALRGPGHLLALSSWRASGSARAVVVPGCLSLGPIAGSVVRAVLGLQCSLRALYSCMPRFAHR